MFNVIFKQISPTMRKDKVWVPSGCQNCWKVVSRPKSLKQLLATVELQKRLGWHAKCGIEHRAHVFGLYGAYWYSRSLQQGLECYHMVRQAYDLDPLLGPDVDIILKRGCTEMEMIAGPSDQYELTPEQVQVELLVQELFNVDIVNRRQPPHAVDYVHARWVEYAYQWGDETVFEFLEDGKPPYPELVTYHDRKDAKNA